MKFQFHNRVFQGFRKDGRKISRIRTLTIELGNTMSHEIVYISHKNIILGNDE